MKNKKTIAVLCLMVLVISMGFYLYSNRNPEININENQKETGEEKEKDGTQKTLVLDYTTFYPPALVGQFWQSSLVKKGDKGFINDFQVSNLNYEQDPKKIVSKRVELDGRNWVIGLTLSKTDLEGVDSQINSMMTYLGKPVFKDFLEGQIDLPEKKLSLTPDIADGAGGSQIGFFTKETNGKVRLITFYRAISISDDYESSGSLCPCDLSYYLFVSDEFDPRGL